MNDELKIFFVLMGLICVVDLIYNLHFPSYIVSWAIGWICGLTTSRYIFYLITEKGVKKNE